VSKEPKLINAAATDAMLRLVREERARQDTRWGVQDIPILRVEPGVDAARLAFQEETVAKFACDEADREGRLSFAHILREELAEAIAAAAKGDLAAARTELLQLAAVAVQAAEAITRARRKDPHTTAQDAWLEWDDEDVAQEFETFPKFALFSEPREGIAEEEARAVQSMIEMRARLTDAEREHHDRCIAAALTRTDRTCNSQQKLADVVRPLCAAKAGQASSAAAQPGDASMTLRPRSRWVGEFSIGDGWPVEEHEVEVQWHDPISDRAFVHFMNARDPQTGSVLKRSYPGSFFAAEGAMFRPVRRG
jgi:hypothetical protein